MLNFYPGPSRLDSNISQYYHDAVECGILEKNHRSRDFEVLYKEVKELFHKKLALPKAYELIFVSSATEAWEVISQSFVENQSLHLYNGSFGEKWFNYAQKIRPSITGLPFKIEDQPTIPSTIDLPELIALTHNETSNGSALSTHISEAIRQAFPTSLIAYDATSSMGGVDLPWGLGDIWFASVQKCFGMPAGLGIMLVSPNAVERATQLKDHSFYNSFLFMLENARKWQTHYTPNVANIFLLKKVLQNRPSIGKVHRELMERSKRLEQAISELQHFSFLIDEVSLRSPTVLCLMAESSLILQVKIQALEQEILLGNGYGSLKESTIRIANFPAISDEEFEQLLLFLSDFDKKY